MQVQKKSTRGSRIIWTTQGIIWTTQEMQMALRSGPTAPLRLLTATLLGTDAGDEADVAADIGH